MRSIAERLASVAAVAVLAAGCATVDPRQGISRVEANLAERLDSPIAWSSDEAEVRATLQRLLAQPLTPDAAVRIALLNNRHLRADLARLGIAQADLVQARLPANPSLSLGVLSGADGTIVEGSVIQDLIGLLGLSAQRKIANAQADGALAQVSQRVVELAAQVRTQYFTVVGDAQTLELAQQVADSTLAAAELAGRQLQAGTLSRREHTLQQAFHAQTILELAQAQARLAADRERLTQLLGLWGADTGWDIPERLPELPQQLPDPALVEQTAVSQRLDLLAARMEAEAAARAAHLTRQFRYLSALGLGVSYKREADGGRFYGPEIELTLPLFDQGQPRIARAQADAAAAAAEFEALAIDVRAQARRARGALGAAADAVRHHERTLLPLQQSIVEETLKFYNGMFVGAYDLLLARQAQVQTARAYVEARKAFWHAWVDLERALGGAIPLAAAKDQRSDAPSPAAPSNDQHQE